MPLATALVPLAPPLKAVEDSYEQKCKSCSLYVTIDGSCIVEVARLAGCFASWLVTWL